MDEFKEQIEGYFGEGVGTFFTKCSNLHDVKKEDRVSFHWINCVNASSGIKVEYYPDSQNPFHVEIEANDAFHKAESDTLAMAVKLAVEKVLLKYRIPIANLFFKKASEGNENAGN
jgi:hypothetical protein